MKFIGAHVSISGGVENAPLNAAAIGAAGFAMFTKNQRQWSAPAISAESAAKFRENCAKHGFTSEMILPHDSYLINLGQPDTAKREKALKAFTDELERCAALGLTMLNFHPGSHLKLVSEKEGCLIIAESVKTALEQVSGVCAVFENTAGQGSNLGFTFEQLADMCSIFHRRLRIDGFSRREALKLTQTFIEATLNKPKTSKEENKNG